MTHPSDELLPVVTVSLFDRAEIEGLVFSALDGSVALVPIAELPDEGTTFVLELRSPDRKRPLMLAGELAGEPEGGFCPMFLKPVDSANAEELLAFLGAVSVPPGDIGEAIPRSVRAEVRVMTPRRSLPRVLEQRSVPYRIVASRSEMPRRGGADEEGLELAEPAWEPERDPRAEEPENHGAHGRAAPERAREAPEREPRQERESEAPLRGSEVPDRRAMLPPLELPDLGPMPSSRRMPEAAHAKGRPPQRESGKSAITLQSIAGSDRKSEAPPSVEVIAPVSTAPRTPPPPPSVRVDGRSAITMDGDGTHAISSAPASVTRDPLLGRSLGGKYTILGLIGAGGAGSVYRARHVMLQKDIAIKVMHPGLRKDPTFGARFHAEALAASKLDHPNVLRVIDFGEEPDGLLYIAMELLVGTELRALLWQGRMPLVRALDIVCQICAALSAASEVGIVHRDIKPENVVITSSRDDEGQTVDLVKVCDFGLAQIVKTGATASGEHRAAGSIAGTPEYMSPEQVRGEELDGRSDIYAVGVVLYELLTGRVPFEGEGAIEILKAHLQKAVVTPSRVAKDVDPEVEAVVLRSLAKDRNQRPANAREMRGELRSILERLRRPAAGTHSTVPATMPIDDAASGFAELFVALASAVAPAPYHEREHPEFTRTLMRLSHAARGPLAGRGAITLAQREARDTELVVQTGAGEGIDLKRAVPGGIYEGYAARIAEAFGKRHVVSLTLKEAVPDADLADMVELLSGPEVSADALRLDLLSRGLGGVSVLFAEEMIGKGRKLPWNVDLCVSRLARDLRALPLLRGVTEEGMRHLRVQIVADVVRTLEKPDDIRLLLESTDLVGTSVAHIPELDALDLRSVIVTALRRHLAAAAAKHIVALASRTTPPPQEAHATSSGAAPPAAARAQEGPKALLAPFASRFLRERSAETDEILRALLGLKVIDLSDLPPELQLSVAAERYAAAMAADPELLFRKLSVVKDLARYSDEMSAASRALLSLAKAGDAKTLARVVAGLTALARGASPGDSTKEGLAASALSSLGDESALAALADALLFGPVAQREPARAVLSMLGAASARALLAVRVGKSGPEPFPRPRFVAALREVGRPALPAIGEHLSRMDPESEEANTEAGAALAEDLLRALPDGADEALGRVVARFLRHQTPAVRRAAAAGLPALLGLRAKPSLMHALDDIDEGVRAAAFAGMRSIRGVDEAVVARVDQVLNGSAPASDELRAGAAGTLAEACESARSAAVQVLVRAMRPKPRSMLSLFKNADDGDAVLVLVTVARVLLAMGGAEGRKEVERRASNAKGELKKALTGLLATKG